MSGGARRALWGAAAAVALAGAIAWSAASACRTALASPVRQKDFVCYYRAGARLRAGQRLYVPFTDRRPYNYLPGLAIAMIPVSVAPYEDARRAWVIGSAALLLAACGMAAPMCARTRRSRFALGAAAAVSLQSAPVAATLAYGQANVLLAVVVCAIAMAQWRRSRWTVALIAAGVLVKTWMAGWIVVLAASGRWRLALGALAASVAAAGASFAAVGWREAPGFVAATGAFAGDIGSWWVVSQSLPAFARVHFEGTPLVRPLVASTALVLLTVWAGTVGLIAGLSAVERGAPQPSGVRALIGSAFLGVTLLLLLPFCDPGYLVLCLPAVWGMLAWGVDRHRGIALGAAGLLVALCIPFPASAPEVARWASGWRSLATTGHFASMTGIWLLALCTLRRQDL